MWGLGCLGHVDVLGLRIFEAYSSTLVVSNNILSTFPSHVIQAQVYPQESNNFSIAAISPTATIAKSYKP